ncbi:uncharacterized protein F5147DRAFT_652525 [Suillus discolor]|uniref:Uncharacterized protein n=1 Tax=Suillus discolor TaxID=1912936 RepID=A0A9P7F6Q1_9AGAM|nr:uncharacterized protein F5147DRAFT_652525 [Suillus discolor]KAG2108938.1 hypothetical protein F5147DRAFT_652525 [Suillus discolor]
MALESSAGHLAVKSTTGTQIVVVKVDGEGHSELNVVGNNALPEYMIVDQVDGDVEMYEVLLNGRTSKRFIDLQNSEKALATEVRMRLVEFGKLHEERRNIQHELGYLMMMKAKYGPGGWKLPMPGPVGSGPPPPPSVPPPASWASLSHTPQHVIMVRIWRIIFRHAQDRKEDSQISHHRQQVQWLSGKMQGFEMFLIWVRLGLISPHTRAGLP